MSRLDLVLQKHPDHEEGVRLLASRDPSGKQKYLEWGAKILASGQALAPEVADVLDLFHKYAGQRVDAAAPQGRAALHHRFRTGTRILADIHAYAPSDLARLRSQLRKADRSRTQKQKKRARLYRLDGSVEADVVYDAEDLVVRHIRSKSASVHYGGRTKWCIAMLREQYFEDYDAQNATFFFFERKVPAGDEYDKVALMMPRNETSVAEAFTALDRRVDMLGLAKIFGDRIFGIFRTIWLRSESYPGSPLFRVCAGEATSEDIAAVYASLGKDKRHAHDTRSILEAIACNDAAPLSILQALRRNGGKIIRASLRGARRRRWAAVVLKDLDKALAAALSIHPSVPAEERADLTKWLRKRHVKTEDIRVSREHGRVAVVLDGQSRRLRRYRRRVRPQTPRALRARAGMFDRMAQRLRKRAKRLAQKAKKKR